MANAIYVPKSDILDLITEENEVGGFTDYSNYSNLWDEVDNIPAANVQSVKQGRWENEYLEDDIWWAECSNCKQETHSKYGRPSTYRYCPNCGARMDGDKANNVRNLTDEETEIYESWIDHEAKDTGVNIMDGDT